MNYLENCISTSEASRRLGVSQTYVIQLCNENKLKHYKTVLGNLIDKDDVERLRQERVQKNK
jgi:excisionase family DNA binding protein